ncbi:MAG: ribbon-helix-helix protein, CopG family [Betaproteobacteria bacterium]|nr:ribbon-helix-helix protein, CopG family [Betaproteobacteria bacterium]
MNTLTLKIPDELDAALRAASERRHVSKSALVREALENALAEDMVRGSAAGQWTLRWRGALRGKESAPADDPRLAHLLEKHLR